ncbi:hypothetical protein Fcan01_28326 [Folsomia candida]|uniref:Uncharacterized protein n=1 Tax=Folsomia candida TaxID=158441 RepID=A0A226CWW9_FOLCA|nr:hypothetical protein Fcan01_28326 [Folsomia candida]
MKCHYKTDQSLVRIVTDHTTPPLLWHLGSIQSGDLIQQDFKDNQVIAPMLTAFNPFQGTQSIHQLLSPVTKSIFSTSNEHYYEMYYVLSTLHMDILMEYAVVTKKWQIFMAERGRLPARILQLTSLLNPLHSLEANDLDSGNTTNQETLYAIEKEVSTCGKTVYIANTNTLDLELDYLRKIYYTTKFYKSDDSILDITFGWIFDRPGNSKIPHYFKCLLESGIHSRLVKEKNDREYRKRRTTRRVVHQRVNPMSLRGSTLTFILICAVVAGLSLLCFGFECRLFIKLPLKEHLKSAIFTKCLYERSSRTT